MSKSQMLRVLVNARLTAAAEEIFALFERTIAEFEEELCRCKEENQRKQERLDSVLSPTVVLLRADLRTAGSPGLDLGLNHNLHQGLNQRLDQGLDRGLNQGLHQVLDQGLLQGLDQGLDQGLNHSLHQDLDQGLDQGLNHSLHQDLDQGLHQEIPKTPRIKEEPEEQCIKQEEQLSVSVPECSSVRVKREELPLLQQREEPQREGPHLHPETDGESSDTDNNDWRAPFSYSGAQMETEAVEDHVYRVQIGDGSCSANDQDASGAAEGADARKHHCSFCEKRFRTKHQLTVHTRVHTGERPFSCTVCGKGFVVGSKVRQHMRIHTGERPFSCTVCGKTFNQRAHLDAHTRIHTGDRPFSCSLCGKSFTQNTHLKGHMLTHRKKALSDEQTNWTPELIDATFGHLYNQA